MSKFTYIELFAGIGGFGTALNRMGGECVFASEIDKFATKAYETLYGGEVLHGDITKVDEKDIPNHDILTAGTPCQSFSVAGKRKGFDDTRGTLFFDVARIAKEKQPKVVWIENVKGLVNHDKGRTLDVMVETLNDIGYVVDFDVLNSKYFGVPQNRERIFIVAIRKDLVEAEPFNDEATTGNTIVPKGKRRIGEWADVFNFDWPEQNEVSTRLRDILESSVEEKYYLDEEKTAKLVAQLEAAEVGVQDAIEYDRKKGVGNIRDIALCLSSSDWRGLNRNQKQNAVAETIGLPIREATKKGYAIAEEGDSVNVQFPDSMTRRGRVGKQIANTLEASSINQGVVESPPKYRIRKLTPLECFRLQGFPDEAHEAVKQAGISDSQRYRQAGNAITVQVVEALGKKLLEMGLF